MMCIEDLSRLPAPPVSRVLAALLCLSLSAGAAAAEEPAVTGQRLSRSVVEVRGCNGAGGLGVLVGVSGDVLYLVTPRDLVVRQSMSAAGNFVACDDARVVPSGAFEGLPARLEHAASADALAVLSLSAPAGGAWSPLQSLLPVPIADDASFNAFAFEFVGGAAVARGYPRTDDGRVAPGTPFFDAHGRLLWVSLSPTVAEPLSSDNVSGPAVRQTLSAVQVLGAPASPWTDSGAPNDGGVWFTLPAGPVPEKVVEVVRWALQEEGGDGHVEAVTTGVFDQGLRATSAEGRAQELRRLAAQARARLAIDVRPVADDEGALWRVLTVVAPDAPLAAAPYDVDAARLLAAQLEVLSLHLRDATQAQDAAIAVSRALLLAHKAMLLPRASLEREQLLAAARLTLMALAQQVEGQLGANPDEQLHQEDIDGPVALHLAIAALSWHRFEGLPSVGGHEGDVQDALDDVTSALLAAAQLLDGWPQGADDPRRARLRVAIDHDLAVVALARPTRGPYAEGAVDALRAAAEAYPREMDPAAWATVQRNLGEALTTFTGDSDGAAQAYTRAIDVRTRGLQPSLWAEGQILLAELRQRVANGDRRQLHQAIDGFEAAAELLEGSPYQYLQARALLGMAQARTELPFEEEGLQIERALADAFRAQELLSPTYYPRAWALAWTTLGYAYQVRTQGHRGDRFDLAIDAYRRALRVYDQQNTPLEWAWTWTNLGTAYLNRPYGEPADNVSEALAAYDLAESVFVHSGRPELLATALNNRGNAYLMRTDGDRLENLAEARRLFKQALDQVPEARFPEDHAQTAANLEIAESYFVAESLRLADPGTARAVEALGDALLLEGLEYRPWILLTRREDRFEQAADAYRLAISRQPDQAIHHHKLSVALWKLLDLDAAIQAQDRAVQLEPNNAWIVNWRRFLEAQRLMSVDPESVRGWMTLAEFHLEAGELAEALSTYREVTRIDPRQVDAWVQVVRIHMSQGRPEPALRAAQLGLEPSPDAFELLAMAQGICHEYLFDFACSVQFAQRMVEADPDHSPEVVATLIEAQLTTGDSEGLRANIHTLEDTPDLLPELELTAATFTWLDRLARGKSSRRAARKLRRAYEGLPAGAPARWSWQGTRHWAGEALGEADAARAQQVIDLLSGPKLDQGDAALEAALSQ